MAESKESKRLRVNTPALKVQLVPHMENVAGEMNAQDLLTLADLTTIQNFRVGEEGKMANRMIAALKLKVIVNPEHYYTFLTILRDIGDADLNRIISVLEFGDSPIGTKVEKAKKRPHPNSHDETPPRKKLRDVEQTDSHASNDFDCFHSVTQDEPDLALYMGGTDLLWDKKILKVYFMIDEYEGNKPPPGIECKDIIDWMNEWRGGVDNNESSVPKFEETPGLVDSDIRVRFCDKNRSTVGSAAKDKYPKPSMLLSLKGKDEYRKYSVLHETGHALGFHHEHQHPGADDVFEKKIVIEDLVKEEKSLEKATKFYDLNFKKSDKLDQVKQKFDGDSVMRYRAKKKWVKKQYHGSFHKEDGDYLYPKSAWTGNLSDGDRINVEKRYKKKMGNNSQTPSVFQGQPSQALHVGAQLPKVQPVTTSPEPPETVYPVLKNKFDMGKMYLLKWKDPDSVEIKLRLIDDMSPKWREIGARIKLTNAQLNSLDMRHQKGPKECMNSVITTWMERKNKKYQPTWNGLLKLLEDVELEAPRTEILRAAASGKGDLYEQ